MTTPSVPPAWVQMPTQEQLREFMPAGSEYDFGFLPAMAQLIMAHPQIGPTFGQLFGQIMFLPSHLDRQEKELVAAVTSAAQDCHY